jgi:Nucleotidyl transferase AbiEii toxin, Type IV TA system
VAVWLKLFEKAMEIIDEAERSCGKIRWTVGGGTMLDDMFGHRDSRDIDIFVPDPQFLLFLTPRVNAKAEAIANKYIEASNAIKIFVAEGEIDFIVAPRLTEPGATSRHIGQYPAMVETPAEILAKKVFYRASDFTARDIFDLAFLIEQGEAQFLNNKPYRDKLDVILRRIKRSGDELRKSFVSIARTGYKVDYDHCVDVIRKFVLKINSGI